MVSKVTPKRLGANASIINHIPECDFGSDCPKSYADLAQRTRVWKKSFGQEISFPTIDQMSAYCLGDMIQR